MEWKRVPLKEYYRFIYILMGALSTLGLHISTRIYQNLRVIIQMQLIEDQEY